MAQYHYVFLTESQGFQSAFGATANEARRKLIESGHAKALEELRVAEVWDGGERIFFDDAVR